MNEDVRTVANGVHAFCLLRKSTSRGKQCARPVRSTLVTIRKAFTGASSMRLASRVGILANLNQFVSFASAFFNVNIRWSWPVRSYNQYCGLAKALDAIGSRWALLMVRALSRGRCR